MIPAATYPHAIIYGMGAVIPPTGREGDEIHALQSRVAGRYSIEREIGRGGMGIVYLARDVSLDRQVAIKLLPREYTVEATLRERFLREARIAARLSHPHIVPVFSVDDHPDAVFYEMGFINGETLAGRIARVGQLRPAEVGTMLQQVAWALAYAHGNGVVHRDIKPENILLEQGTGRAYVLDFGIARAFGGSGVDAQPVTKLTQVGHVVGTAAYMSPEQAAGEEVDGRSDIYSLGIVAYQALAGRLPLEATSAQALLAKHLTEVPAPIASVRPGIPAALAKTIDQMLAKDPAKRPATGEAVADALTGASGARSEVAPPIRNFLRAAEQEMVATFRFVIVIVAIGVSRPDAWLGFAMAMFGTMAGSLGSLFFRARRLAQAGYRWPDLRDSVTVFAEERAEENREVMTPPLPGALRAAWIRAAVFMTIGIAIFIGAILLANWIKAEGWGSARTWGMLLIVGASVIMILATMPLAYAIAMKSSARPRSAKAERKNPALRLWSSPFGELLFGLAGRNVTAAPPRNAASALDQLLAEVEAAVPSGERGIVRELRGRLDKLTTEAHALRLREKELDRTIAEAGPGAAADQISEARKAIAPRVEKMIALADEARLKLLLVRSGVARASELSALAILN